MQRLATVSRTELVNALRRVAPALNRNNALPIFSAVHLMANKTGQSLRITATDGDLTIQTFLEAEIHEDGITLVPGGVLTKFAEGLSGSIELNLDENDLVIIAETSKLKLRTLSPEDWPSIPVAGGEMIALDADTLAAFSRVAYAAPRNDKHPALHGIAVQKDGWVVATDSMRLAAHKIPEGILDARLPARVVSLVAKNTKTATIVVDDRRATFRSDDTSWTVRTIEGPFIAWQPIIPTPSHHITINRLALKAALDRMDIFGGNDLRAIVIQDEGDVVRLRNSQFDVGEGEEFLDCKSDYEDKVAMNPGYLRELLDNLEDEDVSLGLISPLKPVVVQTGDLLQLIMPFRMA